MKTNKASAKQPNLQYTPPESSQTTLGSLPELDAGQGDKRRMDEWLNLFSSFRSFLSSTSHTSSEKEECGKQKDNLSNVREAGDGHGSKSPSSGSMSDARKSQNDGLGTERKSQRVDHSRRKRQESTVKVHCCDADVDEGVMLPRVGTKVHTTSTGKLRAACTQAQNKNTGKGDKDHNRKGRYTHSSKVPKDTECSAKEIQREIRERGYSEWQRGGRTNKMKSSTAIGVRKDVIVQHVNHGRTDEAEEVRYASPLRNNDESRRNRNAVYTFGRHRRGKIFIDAGPLLQVGTQISIEVICVMREVSKKVEKKALENGARGSLLCFGRSKECG